MNKLVENKRAQISAQNVRLEIVPMRLYSYLYEWRWIMNLKDLKAYHAYYVMSVIFFLSCLFFSGHGFLPPWLRHDLLRLGKTA